MNKKLVIIGGGPAGLAAGLAAYDAGVKDILILERENLPGGILNQCIHNGFGLHTFKEELTGPEYAYRFIKEVEKRQIELLCACTVLSVSAEREVVFVSQKTGLVKVAAEAVIFACGCRERPRGALNISGSRPAGVFSAGTAQKLVNVDGLKIGKSVVILGSGDIGLIMARRMTFEGAKVRAVVELMPYSSGLNRNVVQCLNDFNIPLLLSHTVTRVLGRERVEGVVVEQVDADKKPLPATAQTIECDTLLLSVGLLPENELTSDMGLKLDPMTGGAIVDDTLMCEIEGIFACGNMLHVHDLVDYVSEESALAGKSAAWFLSGKRLEKSFASVTALRGVRYCVPQKLLKEGGDLTLRLRADGVYRNTAIFVKADGETVLLKKKQIVTPGEMETVRLTGEDAKKLRSADSVTVGLKT